MTRTHHRAALVLVLALTVALAGCADGGTPTAPPGDGTAGGGDQSGSNDGGGADGNDGGDGDDGQSGSSDGTDATPTAGGSAPTATATATPTPTATPNTSVPTTDRLPALGEVMEPADSFRYRIEISEIDGRSVDYVQEGRYYEGDIYAQIDNEQGTTEVYTVDGQNYVVTGDVCRQVSSERTQNPGNTTQPNTWANESLRPTGTTTLDGQDVYVYESESGPSEFEGPTTIYVSVESSHVVRMESPDLVSETWDFGNVDPVEAPC